MSIFKSNVLLDDLEIFLRTASLVEVRKKMQMNPDHRALLITINPNPYVRHSSTFKGSRKATGVQYRDLSYIEQYEYLIKCFRVMYHSFFSDDYVYFMTFEIGKKIKTVHCHVIVYDPQLQTDYDIDMLRQNVKRDYISIANLKKGSKTNYMNSIVFIDDDHTLMETIQYLFKDYDQSKRYFKGMTNFQ